MTGCSGCSYLIFTLELVMTRWIHWPTVNLSHPVSCICLNFLGEWEAEVFLFNRLAALKLYIFKNVFFHSSFDFHLVQNKQGLFQRNVVSSQINVLSLPNCSVFSIKNKVKYMELQITHKNWSALYSFQRDTEVYC